MEIDRDTAIKPILGYCALALLTVLVFYPSLHGTFLLDDYQSLRDLQRVKSDGFLAYIFSGSAGPTGRPLSLLTFALQYGAWPANPFAFKLVNLLIHVLNGALVCFVTVRLAARLELVAGKYIYLFSLLISALWLLHPVQLYSVLYVVQRMTLLSGFFVLLGVAIYLYYRDAVLNAGKAKLQLVIGVYLCLLLATFCKENGALLPLYLLCIELFLFAGKDKTRDWNIFMLPVLLLPVLCLVLYLAVSMPDILAGYANRDFTIGQRLLTEANVMIDYLRIIIIPSPHVFSLYHDDYPLASGILNDAETTVNIVILCCLVLTGLFLRVRLRIFAFAVFWFLAGHCLESGIIPLEIYFEHRNYLPEYGVIFFVAYILVSCTSLLHNRTLRLSLLVLYPLLIMTVTVIELNLWSRPVLQAAEWAKQHPHSRRALVNLWNVYVMQSDMENAFATKLKLQKLYPDDIYPDIKDLTVTYCFNKDTYNDDVWKQMIQRAAKAESINYDTINELNYIIVEITQGRCVIGNLDDFRKLIYTLINNNNFERWRGFLYEYAASVSVFMHDADSSLENIKMAVKLSPTVENKIYMLRILIALGKYEAARQIRNGLNKDYVLDLKNYMELNKINHLLEDRSTLEQ